MNAKKLALVAVLALMTVPALTAAYSFSSNNASVVAVEGHSVYVLLDNSAGTIKGFDIAVKVRENFPGGPNVLWFNDRFKTYYPGQEVEPCFGIVYATLHGVNLGLVLSALTAASAGGLKYKESYQVVLPDDSFLAGAGNHVAVTDLYYVDVTPLDSTPLAFVSTTIPVWVTTILNSGAVATSADPGCGPWTTTVTDADGTMVIPVDADIFGLWRDVVDTGYQVQGLNSINATLPSAVGQCTNDTFGSYESSAQGLLSHNWCDNAIPGAGIDTLNGNSHPYGGAHDNTGLHTHETSALDVYFCGADSPDCGLGLTPTPSVPRTFAVDCVNGIQCDPASVGMFPDGTH